VTARERGAGGSGPGPARPAGAAAWGLVLFLVSAAGARAQLPEQLLPEQHPPTELAPMELPPEELEPEGPASEQPALGELNLEEIMTALPEGLAAEPEEMEAWLYTEVGHYIRAREAAQAILEENPASYLAHMVLGLTHHYAEANLPRALYHLERAMELFEQRYGQTPGPGTPWRWHMMLLKELALVHADMEHYAEQLAFIARYNELYDPDLIAERAWPLMKLRRFGEARLAAELGLASDRYDQRKIALNALCAIEFEAGNDQKSYRACGRAVDDAREAELSASSVDLTNFAEAARALFRLEEAERIALQAARAPLSWYANPWLELSELYLRQARPRQALEALQKIPAYRARRPPHVRHSDRNETQRAVAAFLLAAGRPGDAIDITSQALAAPDRRSHASRDPLQDRMVIALLDRRSRLSAADMLQERAAIEPLYSRAATWLQALWLRFSAWRSAQQVKRLLQGEKRMVGAFRVGTARSAVVPPWLLGDLVEILGAGVTHSALQQARQGDRRPGAAAYYDALEAEVQEALGEHRRALELACASLRSLGERESMLRARVMAVAARAARSAGEEDLSLQYFESALVIDPGVFRRLDLRIPVRVNAAGGAVSRRTAELLSASPRLQLSDRGLELRVQADPADGSVCLLGRGRAAPLGCGELSPSSASGDTDPAVRLYAAFHRDAFSPRVSFTRADINAIEGIERKADRTLNPVLQPPAFP
jgi:tetratricopeptide (TPR) repeat protein